MIGLAGLRPIPPPGTHAPPDPRFFAAGYSILCITNQPVNRLILAV